jgi:kinetochore protein Mis13/DSN1
MLVARQPLQPLSISTSQMSHRRISARLQQKDDDPPTSNHPQVNGSVKTSRPTSESGRVQGTKLLNEKKRKMSEMHRCDARSGPNLFSLSLDYDEDDDGFLFTRVKKQKPAPKETEQTQSATSTQSAAPKPESLEDATVPPTADESKAIDKRRRKRLSFSTPNPKGHPSVRRSKRLSRENDERDTSPVPQPNNRAKSKQASSTSIVQKKSSPVKAKERPPKSPVLEIQPSSEIQPQSLPPLTSQPPPPPSSQSQSQSETVPTQEEDHSATKIALPFADTPVIKRNKAMREGKSGKGERRSSLGLRGRRASSLIETGNSNGET